MGKNQLKHLYKDSVPCRSSCPADTDIPGYLEAIYNNDFNKAYEINFNDNFFPEILGRVCSRPCEDNCRHGENENGESVSICFSKRAAGKYSSSNKFKLKNKQKEHRKKHSCYWRWSCWTGCSQQSSKDLAITLRFMKDTVR